MTRSELLAFVRSHRLAVQASVSERLAPQAAVIGYAASDRFEIVFDTTATTRKARNLRINAQISLVIGWDDEQTVQLEGSADEPRGAELDRLKQVYFAIYPDGVERLRGPQLTYFRVCPHWARYSDFRAGGSIREFSAAQLAGEPDRLRGDQSLDE